MRHLYEFNNLKWRNKKSSVLVLHSENLEAKPLVAADFKNWLRSRGIEGSMERTPLEDEDYLFILKDKPALDQIVYNLPDPKTAGDGVTAEVRAWWKDDPDEVIGFRWTWGEGVHK